MKTCFLILLLFVQSFTYGQDLQNNYQPQNEIALDVEDKEIAMNVDAERISHYYKHIVRKMLNDDMQENNNEEQKQSKIQSLKIAFLSSKLELKVDESQSFWPLYNEYVVELKATKDVDNELEKDEKILDIRKKNKLKFEKIIGAEKTNALFKAEKEFKKLMQESILMQKVHQNKKQE